MGTTEGDWLTLENAPFPNESFSHAWLAAALTYGVGDVVTTIAIVYFVPLYTEANPVVRAAIQAFGGGGFLAVKLLVFYVCLGISVSWGRTDEDPLLFYGPPLVLTVVGLVTTAFNLHLLLG